MLRVPRLVSITAVLLVAASLMEDRRLRRLDEATVVAECRARAGRILAP